MTGMQNLSVSHVELHPIDRELNLSVSHAAVSAGLPEGAYSHTPAEAHPIDGTTEPASLPEDKCSSILRTAFG